MCLNRQLVVGLLLPLLGFELGCHKQQSAQKPQIPGPAQAPTLTQTLPYEIQPQPVPETPSDSATQQAEAKPKPKPRHTAKRANGNTQAKPNEPATPPSAASADATTASLRPPPNPAEAAAANAVGPDVSSPEATRDRQSTTQLLDNTESQLKRLEGHSLSAEQQAMLSQIRAYIGQSRKAITEGDYERASNLAKKAQLLTDELTKQ